MEYTTEDEILITERFSELLRSCEKIVKGPEDWDMIAKAFNVAKEAHKGVKRRSGEPYIIHPIAVAKICVDEIGLGVKSVVASLLHDVVEDTDLTVEDIATMFTPKIASMVDGLTKIAGVFTAETSQQAESFRKMLLTLLDDVRVILIKIADRLHNMRTLGSMPREKQIKITSETMYLFAPLAYRLGLYAIKTELENLSLKYRFPEQYNEIEAKLKASEVSREEFIAKFDTPIIEKLRANGVDFEISSRVKSVYSIWRKMQAKQIPFEEVYDLFAIRIIFRPSPMIPEKTQCWYIYELVTDTYPSRPDRLRDWITYPKSNGYEALHTTVMGPDAVWVEVQIRSERMDEVAEHGVAAHWKHKYQSEDDATTDAQFESWLERIREALNSPTENAVDFLDNFQKALYTAEIVVFTPKGETRHVPQGATVLDFAYDIHTKLGANAIGAKINHKIESIYTPLKSGDQVEILTSKTAAPTIEWLDHVATPKAKQQIKNYLRKHKQNNLERGQQLFEARMQELGITPSARVFRKVLPAYDTTTKDEFYTNLGADIINLDDVENILRQNSAKKILKFWTLFQGNGGAKKEGHVVGERDVDSDKEEQYEIAECCIPIPGDDVTGYRDPVTGKIFVHKTSCNELVRLASQHGENIVGDIRWSSHKVMSYLSIIRVQGIDRIGILMDLVQVITGELNINIRELKIQSHDGIFEGEISLYVASTDDLNAVLAKIKKINGVDKAQRTN
ncbi:MAG: RelA/SpoT family protein [Rikenellaceae bacterium]|nr:RelA/SpoT family protein [Rikenellaceae bacterium]